ncbi:hypothetical protein Dda_5746 [Drechslerella dactyloides]|uniref:Cytochrome b-c1 complex subunit 8 n=1 Tax=Drechslerella dactyloides TaxID=74499 RepID=A0AAD6NGL5_DREDA|nr:hypothetical protein Dda_5746 [Drechslerella dactyloides]
MWRFPIRRTLIGQPTHATESRRQFANSSDERTNIHRRTLSNRTTVDRDSTPLLHPPAVTYTRTEATSIDQSQWAVVAENQRRAGLARQRGIVQYTLAGNRQRPMGGALRSMVFNGWRRFKGQVFYVAPPFIGAYFLLDWAEKKNQYYNSKAGQAMLAELEAEEADDDDD